MKLLYLSILALVFLVSVNLTFISDVRIVQLKRQASIVSPLPALADSTTFPVLSAQGVIAVDLNSGTTLYEKNPDITLLPASTTKIITALVAMDYYPKDYVLTVPSNLKVDGQKLGLFPGEQMDFDNMIHGLLVYSANDAAEVLAANYPGGRDLFIEAMNLKAEELHLSKTHFQNPTGLDADGHYSTARDMTRLAEFAMRNPYFAQIVDTKEITIASVDGKNKYKIKNINVLLGEVEGVHGVKTGWTENARENLITYVNRDGRRVLIALLGSQDRFGETKELIDWIYTNYKWEIVNYTE